MNAFSAYEFGGERDGMLCVIGRGFYVRDLEDLRLTMMDGKRAAMFTLAARDGSYRATYRTAYPTVVLAAMKVSRG